ncbi:Synapse-associated protein 1 [Apophysomyces sp. BC1034]|nr:Synapse-associated protein 1 [Apophysomyces sp. BC1015]KAG0193797.1 Synapse-associated protein 1 [Apophysomyces sp. BC1034]
MASQEPVTPSRSLFSFSNVTSTVSSFSQSLQNKALPETMKRINELSQTVQKRARELPANLAQLPGALESERDQFIKSKAGEERLQTRLSEPVAPWEGYGQQYEQEMKKSILEIATDQRNFLIPPPEDTSFQFDMKAYGKSAAAALKEDPELSKMRFLLVPQHVTESTFWRNYFYRVTLVKQSVLSSTKLELAPSKEEVLFDFTNDDSDDEPVLPHKELEKPAVSADKAIPPTSKKEDDYEEMEEWERELRKAAGETL